LKTLRLVLGDQLNIKHSWFNKIEQDVCYVMMEIRSETDYVRHHIQKVIAFFLAMRTFKKTLEKKGHKVHYYEIDSKNNNHNFKDNILSLIKDLNITKFEYQEPDEFRLHQELENFTKNLPIQSEIFSTEHFLTSRGEVKKFFEQKKIWRMENFYRMMREKYNILLDEDNKPIGGKWNYDFANRQKWRNEPPLPARINEKKNVETYIELIKNLNINTFGEIDEANFIWPISREEALLLLQDFKNNFLKNFGYYQDSMHDSEPFLFHSLLSFCLNTKMLHPLEVVKAAESMYEEKKEKDLLPAIEGFIRQVLGWREYIRGVYWAKMPDYGKSNYFEYYQKLPSWFWNGKTSMNCMCVSINDSLKNAYAHHIQRLMVIGNISLLLGLNPHELHLWYLGVYIDAIEWVEMPNTIGMSQFADGGFLASKPYNSSASYINKMSNYCAGCKYNPKEKFSDDACPLNALYWNFYIKQKEKLMGNQRLGIVWMQINKISHDEKIKITEKANEIINNIERL
jgi:deoxyribodipyrimidine photolyase-related protein